MKVVSPTRFPGTAILLALLLFSVNARATVTINIFAADLQTSSGGFMATNGLVILVASTVNTNFSGPISTEFSSQDDIVLFRWDLRNSGTTGMLFDTTGTLSFTPPPWATTNWDAGDPVALYWFPTLTIDAIEPGLGTQYGFYTDGVGIDGSSPWLTPTDGSTIGLNFLTDSQGGSNPLLIGRAGFVVTAVPEPSSLLLAIVAFGIFRFHNRRKHC